MGIPLPCWSAIRAPFKISAFLLLLLCLQAVDATAQTKTAAWTGEGTTRWILWPFWSDQVNTTDWNNSDNWSPRSVPDANTDVTIGRTTNQPIIAVSNAVTVRSLTIASGASLNARNLLLKVTVTGDFSINSGGTLTNNGSDMVVNGNWTNNGTYAENRITIGTTTYYPTIEFGGINKSIGGSSANAFNYLIIRGTITLGNNINLTPLASVLSKFEVLGTFDPEGHKVTFTSAPSNGFTLGDGAVLKVKATTLEGNYSLAGGAAFPTSMFPTSVIDYAAAGNQTIHAATYQRLHISGGGVKTLAQTDNTTIAANSAQTQLNVQAGTLDLGSRSLNRTGTGAVAGGALTVANGATLKIGGTGTFPSGFASRDLSINSTVEYSGANQTVTNEAYGNVTLSGSGTKTMPAANMTIGGMLTGGGSAAFAARGNMAVNGDVVLSGSATFSGGNFTHTIGGNWTNNATFSGEGSTVILSRAGKSIIRTVSGAASFHNLTISGAGTSISAPEVNVSGDLATTGAGTFAHASGGKLTMTGTAKSISGSSITLQDFVIDGSVSTITSFEIQGSLTVNAGKSFTATAGAINMTGTAKTIGNAGVLTLFGLRVNGVIGTTSSFHIKSDVSGAGNLSATAGTINFSGNSTFNGSHNLYHVTVSGSLLRMAANANLGIAGNFTAGPAFDAFTNSPNTVMFNGAASQTIPGVVYHHIAFANAGSKSAGASITANGNLSIGNGATFLAGANSHTINGNWVNNGAFTAGTSTIILVGGANTTMAGPTTFNALTLQKASAGNTVTLITDITAGTLHMNNGLLITGASQIYLTGDRTGSSWVVGKLTRTHSFEAGKAYAFNGPYTQLSFATATGVSGVSVNLQYQTVAGFPSGAALNGTYTIAVPSGTYSGATLQLQYLDSELNGNTEAGLQLYKRISNVWTPMGKKTNNVDQDWVRQEALADVNGIWTLSSTVSVYRWKGGSSTAWELAANWENITGTTPMPAAAIPGEMDIVELGGIIPAFQPQINSAAKVKVVQFRGTAPITLDLVSGSLAVEGNLAATGAGTNVQHRITTGNQPLNIGGYLTLNDGSQGNSISLLMGSGTTTITGDLNHAGTGFIALGSGHIKLSGNYNFSSPLEFFDKGTGTFTYEGSNAQVIGVVYYNNLTIDKPSGVATLVAPAEGWVAGDITVNSGRFSIPGGNYNLEKNVIQNGGVLEVGNSEITVMGNWTKRGGTFEANTSHITLQGSHLEAASPLTFNNLTVAKEPGTTMTVTGNVLVNNILDLQSGTVDLGTGTLNRSAAGGRFIMGGQAALLLSGNNFPARYNNMILHPLSTVKYQGNTAQNITATTYGNLEIENGSTKTLLGATKVAGDLTIYNDASLNANEQTLTLHGNFKHNGAFSAGAYTAPNPPSGTLVLDRADGTNKVISGNTLTLNNLVVKAGANYTITTDLIVNGNVDINGNQQIHLDPSDRDKGFDLANNGLLNTPDVKVYLAGDMTNDGILVGAGLRTFVGTRVQHIRLNAPLIPDDQRRAATIVFDGSEPPVFNSKSDAEFADLIIKNTGGVRTSMNWRVYGTLTVHEGAAFDGGMLTHTIHTGINNSGTIVSEGIIHFDATPVGQNTGNHTFNFGASADAFQSMGTLRVSGTGKVVPMGMLPASFNNLVLDNSHQEGIDMATLTGNDVHVKGNVVIGSSTVWHGSNKRYTLEGGVNNDGIVEAKAADFTFMALKVGPDGKPEIAQVSGAGTATVQNFIVGDNARVNLTQEVVNIYKDFVHNGADFDGTKTELKFKGAAPATIIAKGNQPINIQHVHIAKENDVAVTLRAPLEGISTLMVESGVFDTQEQTIATTEEVTTDALSNSSYFSIDKGASYRVAGSNTFPEFVRYKFDPESTVVFEGGDQAVKSIQYGNLQLLNAGTKTFAGDTARIAGTLTVARDVAVVAPRVVEYNGALAQTVAALNYNNLILSNSGFKTLDAGTTGIAQQFLLADTTGLNAAGIGVTVTYNGASPQQVLPTNYYNLTLRNASAKRFSETTGIAAAFSLLEGATADLTGENTISFNGNRAQQIPGLDYYNLTSAGTGVKTLASDASIVKELTLTAGEIRTGNNSITLGEEGRISEIETAFVTGAVVTQRELTTVREDFGGMGLAITPRAGAPGLTTVIRNTGTAVGANQNSIMRNFRVLPFGSNTNLNAVVEMAYFDHELNNVDEGMMSFYTSNDGSNWKLRTEEQTKTENLVSMFGEQTLQRQYTLGGTITPLPVELMYFKAVRSGPDALLTWATASEQDSKGFAVEVSIDGYRFRQLGFVESGNGNTVLTQKYSYTDKENGKTGVRYYRLRQVDHNGDEKIYSPKFVNFGSVEKVNVVAYPNPFNTSLTLSIATPDAGIARINMYDTVGKLLLSAEQSVQGGSTHLPLKVDALNQTGMYVLTVELNGTVHRLKLLRK
ncbi:T9SS type A sorting domain-containing protein [Pontibacter sp. FD36]|uniref:T9SS type A sorting domain-containing protein n=1 Tax=Pontibacter sp. FD36 TaxID=2789860 RepID=UPI001E405FAB|nr:T9SS type A sorting domain-containing protein [Pontibacter sp. FD36]